MGDDTPKYLNSPESPVYKKSRVLVRPRPGARRDPRASGRVIVVEGYFDLLALHRAGLHEVRGALRDRAHPEPRAPAAPLRRGSRAAVRRRRRGPVGRRARAAHPARRGLRVRAAFLPLGEDPDTLLAKSGVPGAPRVRRQRRPTPRSPDRAGAEGCRRPRLGGVGRRPQPGALPARAHRSGRARGLHPAALEPARDPARRARRSAAPGQGQGRARASDAARRPRRPTGRATSRPPSSRASSPRCAAHPDLHPSFAELDFAWIAPGPGRELLARLLEASREHGRGAVAQLLSSDSEPLPAEQHALLLRLCAEPGLEDAAIAAARSISDCIASSRSRRSSREKRELEARRESCTDAGARNDLDRRDPADRDEATRSARSRRGRSNFFFPSLAEEFPPNGANQDSQDPFVEAQRVAQLHRCRAIALTTAAREARAQERRTARTEAHRPADAQRCSATADQPSFRQLLRKSQGARLRRGRRAPEGAARSPARGARAARGSARAVPPPFRRGALSGRRPS